MRLYTDNKGNWVGTQADAKKLDTFEQVEVPTDKPRLLEFLNEHCVGSQTFKHSYPVDDGVLDYIEPNPVKTHPQSCSSNPNLWDVSDAVLNCDRKHLGNALGAIISRLHDEMGAT